jgi:hypothetical protein
VQDNVPMSSPTWAGEVEGDEPAQATHRGQVHERLGEHYLVGTLWAKDGFGRRAARLTFEVYPSRHMILLDNIDSDKSAGDAGDVQGRGAARALLDALDIKYPPPDWWIAADRHALHSAKGVALMRSRRKPGRQWVHTSDCEERLPSACSCEFDDPPQ